MKKYRIVIYVFTVLCFEVNVLKRIKIYSEVVYLIAQFGLTLAVAILAAADFGVSMVVAPAYILNLKFPLFSFF